MQKTMQKNKYIYSFVYNDTESELCKLESKYLFGNTEKDKMLFSDIKVDPSSSAFIKKRFDIILSSDDYLLLIEAVEKLNICDEGFKVEYLVLNGDETDYQRRLKKVKDIGYRIRGVPEYYKPIKTYSLCYCKGIWYFGVLAKNSLDWYKHKQKPFSYSNSININIAKALVNIARGTYKGKKLLDVCCGVGTIMLEACFSGISIEGCDINWKVCKQARANLSYFNYSTTVYRSDIKDINSRYDTAIIDLPYNLFSCANEDTIAHIIRSASEIADRLVIVSMSDITKQIIDTGFRISDSCSISKRGKVNFTRTIWVCEK